MAITMTAPTEELPRSQGNCWSAYLSGAETADREFVGDMTAISNGVLVFTGLFAAVVATFVVQTYSLLQSRSPAKAESMAILREMLSIMRMNQSSNDLLPTATPMDVSTMFIPPTYATTLNSVWALSLVLSLFSAFMATLVQQWVRRYLNATQAAGSARDRALLHASLHGGIQQFAMRYAVDLIVILLHSAVALFLYGLAIYFEAASHIVARTVKASCIIFVVIYFLLTILPLLFPTSPYSTPMSEPLRWPLSAIVFLVRWSLCTPLFLANHYLGLGRSPSCWDSLSLLLDPLALSLDRRARLMASLRARSTQRSKVFLQQLSRSFNNDADTRLFFAHLPQMTDLLSVQDDQQTYRLMLQAGVHHEIAWFIESMSVENPPSTEDICVASRITSHLIQHSTFDSDAVLPLFMAWHAKANHSDPETSLIALCRLADARLRFLTYPSPKAMNGSHVKAWWKHMDDANALSAQLSAEHSEMQGSLFRLEIMPLPIPLPTTSHSASSNLDGTGAPYLCRHLSSLAFVSFVHSALSTIGRGSSSGKPIPDSALAACAPTQDALVEAVIADIPARGSFAHYQLTAQLKMSFASRRPSSIPDLAAPSASRERSVEVDAALERWQELKFGLQRISDALRSAAENGGDNTNTNGLHPFPDMYNAIERSRVGPV